MVKIKSRKLLSLGSLLVLLNPMACYSPAPVQRGVDEALLETEAVGRKIYTAPAPERTEIGMVARYFYSTPERRVVQQDVWELQGSQKPIAPPLKHRYCPGGSRIVYERHLFEKVWEVYTCDDYEEKREFLTKRELPFDPDKIK